MAMNIPFEYVNKQDRRFRQRTTDKRMLIRDSNVDKARKVAESKVEDLKNQLLRNWR